MRQLAYTMLISNNRALFHLWWKENLVKHQKVSKYYENDCTIQRKENSDVEIVSISLLNGIEERDLNEVKFLDGSLWKIWSDTVSLKQIIPLQIFQSWLSQILCGPFFVHMKFAIHLATFQDDIETESLNLQILMMNSNHSVSNTSKFSH